MAKVLVQDGVDHRKGLALVGLGLVGTLPPTLFEPLLDGRAVALHNAMLVVGIASAEAVVPGRPIHDLPAEVELAHERLN